MACSSPAGLDGLLCCADERLNDLSVPPSHDRTLARRADASKPKTSTYVDSNEDDRRSLPAVPTHPASVARKAVPRHYPRWEPGALAAPAGICAGGEEKSSSLPRPPTLRHQSPKGSFNARAPSQKCCFGGSGAVADRPMVFAAMSSIAFQDQRPQ
jgi:hypothetical protein